jgi:cytidyltransferase-like protein
MKKKIVIVSGYFNPIHKGHLEYFINAKNIGDLLFVIVNSDFQRQLKESLEFQKEDERLFIVEHIKEVDKAFLAIDRDRTVCQTLKFLHDAYYESHSFIFANGGDQNNQSIPERMICESLGIDLVDGLGDKVQSSSWLLSKSNSLNKNLDVEKIKITP